MSWDTMTGFMPDTKPMKKDKMTEYNVLEKHIRALYKQLNHYGMYTQGHCQDVENNKLISREMLFGEIQVINFAKKYNGLGNVFIGRNPRDGNGDVVDITSVTFDLDPKDYDRTKGSSNEQIQRCVMAAKSILDHYSGGYIALSGNGVLLVYSAPPDFKGDVGSFARSFKNFSEQRIKAIVSKFSEVKLDPLYDNERLVKLVGTVSCRGQRRLSRFLSLPGESGGGGAIFNAIKSTDCNASEGQAVLLAECNAGSEQVRGNGLYLGQQKESGNGVGGLIPHGQRHNYLVQVAGSLRRRGLSETAIFEGIKAAYNDRCDKQPGDSDSKLRAIAQSVMRYSPEEINYGRLHMVSSSVLDSDNDIVLHTPGVSLEEYKTFLYTKIHNNGPELCTGIYDIDKVTQGLKRGSIYIVAARPGIGKTSFCIQTSYNLCKQGKKVLYLSTEMTYKEIWNWFISCATGVQRDAFETKDFSDKEKEDTRVFMETVFKDYSFSVCDSYLPRMSTIQSLIEKDIPDVIVIDHIQHISGQAGQMKDYIAEFVKELKILARDKNIAILAAAQLSRPPRITDYQTKETIEAKPVLSSLAECGKLEQEASVVILAYTTGRNLDEDTPIITFELAKNRYGKSNVLFDLAFDQARTNFKSLSIDNTGDK